MLRLLASERMSVPSRVLAIGTDASPLAQNLRAAGHEVIELRPEDCDTSLPQIANTSPASFDLVIALGFIEWIRWDRWALQLAHMALKPGGKLLLVAPDLYSVWSLIDPRYVGAKLAKRWRAGRGPQTPRAGAAPARAYPARRLRRMLERLGFEPGRWMGLGAPRLMNGLDRWLPTHHLVMARKATSGTDVGTRTSDSATLRPRFESENRAFLRAREVWRRKLGTGMAEPGQLEPERFSGARVLVLSPHPDDEIIGCGGTLLRLVQAGARVTVLQATDGSASAALDAASSTTRHSIRLEEARVVEAAAGFQPTIFWGEDNRDFRVRDDIVDRLRETLRALDPALVFTPFVADIHEDHQTLNRILAAALEDDARQDMHILGYEVWSLAPADLWCDVTSRMGEVERLLRLYETAMKVDDFVHMCSTRNAYHSLTLANRPGYAEAFFTTGPSRFRDIMRDLIPARVS